MTISFKSLLVMLAFCFGFLFGTSAFALTCPDGEQVGYSYDGEIFGSPDAAAEYRFEQIVPAPRTTVRSIYSGQATVTSTKSFVGLNGNDFVLHATAEQYGFDWKTIQTCTSANPPLCGVYPKETTLQNSVQVSLVCVTTPEPEPDQCADLAGNEESFTTLDLYSVAGCVNNCLVSSVGGGRVQVQIEGGDGTVYTSGNYTGASCTGSESMYSKVVESDTEPAPYKMELVNGVPTFTANGDQIKLASDNNGSSGNLTNTINQLNPDKSLDVRNSSGSTGVDGSNDMPEADTVIKVTNVNNVTQTTTSGYQLGWNSADISGTGGATGTGDGDGDTSGSGDTVVNVDLSGVESKLDGIQSTLDGLGSDVTFSGDEVGTFASITDTFKAEIMGAPLMQVANTISFPSGSGTCPAFAVSVLGGNVSTNIHCEIWDTVKGTLSYIMLFVYAVFGIRTIMSA